MSVKSGLAIAMLLAGALVAAAQQPGVPAKEKPLTEEQKKELEEAKKLNSQVVQLFQQRKYTEALPLAQKVLEIREKNLGPEHPDVGLGLYNLASQYQEIGRAHV